MDDFFHFYCESECKYQENLSGTVRVTHQVVTLVMTAQIMSFRYELACRGALDRVLDLRSRGHGFVSRPGTRRINSGHVSHTYVPLSPSSISWYWPKGGDALRLGSKGRYGSCMGGR